jgi:hypothetical protein
MASNIVDVARSARAIGAGLLLSPSSYRERVGSGPWDWTAMPLRDGSDRARQLDRRESSLAGFGVEGAYLPTKKITITIVSTKRPGSEIDPNYSDLIARQIATYRAPRHPISLYP